MGRVNQTKTEEYNSKISSVGKCFEKSERLNLNDLLQRRQEEKRQEEKRKAKEEERGGRGRRDQGNEGDDGGRSR